MEDKRNVIDKFKGRSESEIISELDSEDHGLVIALENTERDFNMGTIVRSANAFGVRQIYVIGRRQWNKRGAMMTDKYLHITYLATTEEFVEKMRTEGREIIAIDNIPGSVNMSQTSLPKRAVLVFGQEGPGISAELANAADQIVAIEQFGSTRSINVGAAATVAMYCWLQQNVLAEKIANWFLRLVGSKNHEFHHLIYNLWNAIVLPISRYHRQIAFPRHISCHGSHNPPLQ